jgi:hypothetical protein
MSGLFGSPLTQRFPLGDSSSVVISLRRLQGLREPLPEQSDRVAEGFNVRLGNLDLNTASRWPEFGPQGLRHCYTPFADGVHPLHACAGEVKSIRQWSVGFSRVRSESCGPKLRGHGRLPAYRRPHADSPSPCSPPIEGEERKAREGLRNREYCRLSAGICVRDKGRSSRTRQGTRTGGAALSAFPSLCARGT